MRPISQEIQIQRRLPELLEIELLVNRLAPSRSSFIEGEVRYRDFTFPIHSFRFGCDDPTAPTLAFVGGVHGLERIGTSVILSFLKTLCQLKEWDKGMRHILEHCRLVVLPLINPVGMFLTRRSNGNGVDLMRNAPVEAAERPNIMFVGGHRYSPKLPWYRGPENAPMEEEANILIRFVQRELGQSRVAVSVDFHSGFGVMDRLWFPYARSRKPFEDLGQVFALKQCLDRTLPHHIYCVEPQSLQYVTHGDLWDYLYLEHLQKKSGRLFLPLCLEMGSWIWVKKNPRQLFSSLGIFNPLLPHRLRRTLRRHGALMDFLLRATASHDHWLDTTPERLEILRREALKLWYPKLVPV